MSGGRNRTLFERSHSEELIMRNSMILMLAMVSFFADAGAYQFINSINVMNIGTVTGRSCIVADGNQLIINGRFVRYLTPQDQEQLKYYEAQVSYWNANLQQHIQHRINMGTNRFRAEMNRVFGPGGSFHRSFTGPFWESVHLNTPPPTTMPMLPPEMTVEVPQTPFPDPPPFCWQ
uniref:Pepsin inhibitor-3-like repeated domain-containing protein n=2 Tax=Parascaris univalens TaxID=6257 RepID=A0A915CHX6_PARUN